MADQWEYMTVTLGGGDALYSALLTVKVGTFGGAWKQSLEPETIRFVGGYEKTYNNSRRTPEIPLFPFYTEETNGYSVHERYDAMFCVFRQRAMWVEAIGNDPWGTPLFSGVLPKEFEVRGVSESIDPLHANTKVTLSLAWTDTEETL